MPSHYGHFMCRSFIRTRPEDRSVLWPQVCVPNGSKHPSFPPGSSQVSGIRSTFWAGFFSSSRVPSQSTQLHQNNADFSAFRGPKKAVSIHILYTHVWYDKCFIIIKIIFVRLFSPVALLLWLVSVRIETGQRSRGSSHLPWVQSSGFGWGRVQSDSFTLILRSLQLQDTYEPSWSQSCIRTTSQCAGSPGNKIISPRETNNDCQNRW